MVAKKPNSIERVKLGLTGVELVLAIAIAGLLIGMALTKFSSIQARHRDNERRADIKTIQQKVQEYFALSNEYPESLSQISNLPADACQAPKLHGTCSTPDYSYRAFKEGTIISANTSTNCHNAKPAQACVNYIIFSNKMETVGNPYFVRSY